MLDRRDLLLASLDRQFFFAKGAKDAVVSSLCGLQAQFANNPGHALRIRASDFADGSWRDGLVKTWTFRGTLHMIREDELGLFLSARGRPRAWSDDWGLPPEAMARWSDFLEERIRAGVCDREELKAECRRAGMTADEMACAFHGWGGLIKEMSKRGLIAYAPGAVKRFVACKRVKFMDRDKARSLLLERYFRHLGPATLMDCATFFGYTKKTLQELLKQYPLPLKSVRCDGEEYWHLGDLGAPRELPPCLFLAGFDQLLMAYKDRRRLLDDKNRGDVVTNTGIVHPTVLVEGRLRAKWKKDGRTLTVAPFAAVPARMRRRIVEAGMELFAGAVDNVRIFGT